MENKHIHIIGCGGVCNYLLPALLRKTEENALTGTPSFHQTLVLHDADVVEEKNLHRQTLFDRDQVGMYKCDALSVKLLSLMNPGLRPFRPETRRWRQENKANPVPEERPPSFLDIQASPCFLYKPSDSPNPVTHWLDKVTVNEGNIIPLQPEVLRYVRGSRETVAFRPEDVVFSCADSYIGRLTALRLADTYNLTAIVGANEVSTAEAFVYLSQWKGTDRDPRTYYPEYGKYTSQQEQEEVYRMRNPPVDGHGCAATVEQTCLANMQAATYMLWLNEIWTKHVFLVTDDKEAIARLPWKLNNTWGRIQVNQT